MAGYSGGLSLHSLSTPELKALLGDEGIEGHVLRLEWSRPIAILQEDTTEACCEDALAYIAPRTDEHQRCELSILRATHLPSYAYACS